jgi:hypothetical protein
MENTINGQKSIQIEHISVSDRTLFKNFRCSLSILDRFDKPKPSHATVPLRIIGLWDRSITENLLKLILKEILLNKSKWLYL